MNTNKLGESLSASAIAFAKLIDDYVCRKTDRWGNSPFRFGKELTFMTSSIMGIGGDMGDFIDSSKSSIEALKEAAKIIGFGIDYKRYAKFKMLTPYVYHYVGGRYESGDLDEGLIKSLTVADANFCIEFVIESALALQEFDFELTQP